MRILPADADADTQDCAHRRGTFLLAGVIEDCDENACRIWGRRPGSLIGTALADLSAAVQPDGSAAGPALSRRVEAADAGLAQCFEWRFTRPDGGAVDCLVSLEPAGEGRRLRGRMRDLTGLGHAESARRETESRLRQILDNTSAAVFVKDREGRYLTVNRRFLEIFALEEAQVIGRTDRDVLARDLAEALRANDLEVLEARGPREFEERLRLADGEHTYLSIKFPLFDTAGAAYAVCGISTDITARKRMEDALRNLALGVSAARGGEVFRAIAEHLAASLGVDFAFVGQTVDGAPGRLRTLAIWHDGALTENMEYDLAGTPCQTVVGLQFQFIPDRIQDFYPGDSMLSRLGFESYAGFPLFDSEGRPLGLIAVTHRRPLSDRSLVESMLRIFSVRAAAEIERLEAERVRQMYEISYRAIFDASEDAILVHDMDTGAIVDVNPKACEAYGYSREELRRTEPGALGSGVPPYTGKEAARLVARAREEGPQRFEWHRRNREGSLHWDEVYLKRATIGGVDRVLAFTREITDRKAREDALRKSEDRLRATVEAALDSIVVMDGEGRIVEFNPAAEHCFGHARADVLGRSLAEVLIPERERAAHHQGLARYHETRRGPFLGRRVEVSSLRADGTEFPAELAISVAQGASGDVFIGYMRDITERKRAEAERGRLEAQLRQAQKMEAIGHLAGGIAHDFNNILTGVMGYVAMASERAGLHGDERLGRYLDRAHRSGQRAQDLIRQLLTFSRGQRGEPRPLDLAALVRDAVGLLGSTLPSSLELSLDLPEDLPPVNMDPVHVEQVLMNLCINARDAMEGTGHLRVAVAARHLSEAVCASCRQPVRGRFVALAVGDSGPGIAPAHLERIFEPFFTTKAVGKGSGMGLSTVHGIVHEHGAHLMVDTAPGEGTVFRVLFPALDGPGVRSGGAAEAGTGSAPLPGGLQGRVLVVDDDESVSELMQDLFESWGLEVVVARDGAAGLEAFSRDTRGFDLALLDQTMPRLTGLELAGQLLALRPRLPILMYTGYSEHISERRVKQAGVHGLLRKPVDPALLYERVRDLLGASPG